MSAPHLPPKQPKRKSNIAGSVPALLLLVFTGLLAGATAALMVLSYYPDIVGFRFPYEINQPQLKSTLKTPSDAGVQARVTQQSILNIFSASARVSRGGVSWLPKQKALGQAVLLTEDGWALSSAAVGLRSIDVIATDDQGSVYPVEKTVVDAQSGFAFIKIDVGGMSAVPLSTKNNFFPADNVFSITDGVFFSHTLLPSVYDSNRPLRSDSITRFPALGGADYLPEGAPLFALDGSLAGVVNTKAAQVSMVPISAVRSVVKDVIAGDGLADAQAYISYISMPDVVPAQLSAQSPRAGAYVVGVGRTSTAVPLPALRVSDIIVAVNDEPVTGRADLALLLSRMRPAQEVLLSVFRDGQYIRIPIIVSA